MTASPQPETCTCGPGVWTTCDQCSSDAWCNHHCDFPCDDVTCEGGVACTGCLTGRLCPVHNDDDGDDDVDDWEQTVDDWKAEIEAMPLPELLASFGDEPPAGGVR